jgi:tRNA pseudouridine32 synthase/23S rRNA pseudouridine746 synthase
VFTGEIRDPFPMSSSSAISASGFCTACGTVHSLGEGLSRRYARELMEQLEEFKRIDFPQKRDYPPRPSGTPPPEGNLNDPLHWRGGRSKATDGVGFNHQSELIHHKFSTDYLWGDARGQMFGVLECEDRSGNTAVLKAFSGQYNGKWMADGWVPPIIDVDGFNRLVDPADREIKQLDRLIAGTKNPELIRQRKALSQGLMKQLHALYQLTNFRGETRPLTEVFQGGIPTGAGDCCAPKLLNYAALHGLKPLGLSEFYWGKENKSGTRQHKQFYPACVEKCQPILGFMLCGAGEWSGGVRESWSKCPTIQYSDTPILHFDNDLVVVVKPSGLLAVPGKGEENQDCATARIKQMFPGCINQPEVHRLDMDTSGLMVVALTADAQRELSRQFHDRETEKRYIALLDGELTETEGTIELPFRLDIENRPLQIYDPVHGKTGITRWKKISVENGKTRVEFFPITGRTHQLRVHAASEHGLGFPILGDRLYGTGAAPGQLKLHASYLSFTHPTLGKKLEFTSEPPF